MASLLSIDDLVRIGLEPEDRPVSDDETGLFSIDDLVGAPEPTPAAPASFSIDDLVGPSEEIATPAAASLGRGRFGPTDEPSLAASTLRAVPRGAIETAATALVKTALRNPKRRSLKAGLECLGAVGRS